jgi:hypothetical protein
MSNCIIWKKKINLVTSTPMGLNFDDFKSVGLCDMHMIATWNMGDMSEFA